MSQEADSQQMEVSISTKPATLVGEWAKDALQEINLEWLTGISDGQEEQSIRVGQRERWERVALLLGLGEEGDEQLLPKLQQYIARTHPAKRCPCRRGLEINSSKDHFPFCEFQRATKMKEKRYEQLEEKVQALQREKDQVERWWFYEEKEARHFELILRASFCTHLSTKTIKKMVELGLRELDLRWEEMPPPPAKRTRHAIDDDEDEFDFEN